MEGDHAAFWRCAHRHLQQLQSVDKHASNSALNNANYSGFTQKLPGQSQHQCVQLCSAQLQVHAAL
jgi:hypothetical protein